MNDNYVPTITMHVYAKATFMKGKPQLLHASYLVRTDGDMSLLPDFLANAIGQKFPGAEKIEYISDEQFETEVNNGNCEVLREVRDRKRPLLSPEGF